MAYQVQILPAAQRQLGRIDFPIRRRISKAIDDLTVDPRPAGAKKLVGVPDGWRIRIGDYRVLYEIHDRRLLVLVVEVGHRSDVYR